METKRVCVLAVAGVVWLAAAGFGFARLLDYSVTPGPGASAPSRWPEESRVSFPAGQSALVMTVHPHCPCSRASVIELNNLMALVRDHNVRGYVLIVKPAEFPDEWARTESYRAASRIPGVTVLIDVDGEESGRLGARTSGQVVLYNPQRRLVFAGGLTRDRGHVGDSPGRQRILSLVKHGTADANESLVFGCALGAKMCPRPLDEHGRRSSAN